MEGEMTAHQPKAVSRRKFLNRLGQVGGTKAVFQGTMAMGLLSTSTANATIFREQWDQWTGPQGVSPKIVVLGADIAGLTARAHRKPI